MENSEFIRPAQTAESLQLTPVSSGATCETFKYQQWNKWFLLKRLKPSLRKDPAAIAAFEKEFDLGIHLDHPGIARYFDKGTDGEGIFLVENAAHLVLPVPEKLKLVLEQPHDRSKKNSIKPMRATANNRRSFFMAAHNI